MDQFSPDNPTFPLDPEVIVAIPKDLPSEVPTTAKELIDFLPGTRRGSRTRGVSASRIGTQARKRKAAKRR